MKVVSSKMTQVPNVAEVNLYFKDYCMARSGIQDDLIN